MVKIIKLCLYGFVWFLIFNIPFHGKPLFVYLQTVVGLPTTAHNTWDVFMKTQEKASKAFSNFSEFKEKFTQK